MKYVIGWTFSFHKEKHRYRNQHLCFFIFLVAPLGFEPRQTEPESAVLPLHNRAIFVFLHSRLGLPESGAKVRIILIRCICLVAFYVFFTILFVDICVFLR